MSTEPKSKDLETNALAGRMARNWDRFKKGQLVSYRVMALVLVVAAGGFVWWYIAHERGKEKSRAWIGLEGADSVAGLEKFRGEDKIIVNLRCLEGLDVDALEIQTFDGKSY